MKILQSILTKIKRIGYDISNLPHDLYIILQPKQILVQRAYVKFYRGRLYPNNWGDDLNLFLIQKISGKKVLFKNKSILSPALRTNYVCIGSVLEWGIDKHSVVWGSGIMHGNHNLKIKPKKVLAVRGHLTRQYLLSQGIACPEIFGDPALLLPLYYRPTIQKQFKIGFIPHLEDKDNPFLKDFLSNHKDTTQIDLGKYSHWQEIIDHICQCEIIVSSSLHGLIVSDAYGIPNVWAKFSDKISGGDFKYQDYFSSVGRKSIPLLMHNHIDRKIIEEKAREWEPINFDSKPLLNAFPFKHKEK